MPVPANITFQDYYDLHPDITHRSGDIWRGLPSGLLLGTKPIRGIVITPACDLINRKVETITYIPILSIAEFFSTAGPFSEVANAICGQHQVLFPKAPLRNNRDTDIPTFIEAVMGAIQEIEKIGFKGKKDLDAAARIVAGMRILKLIADKEIHAVPQSDLRLLFGKEWSEILEKFIRNSYTFCHFLPQDQQDLEWSGVPMHSIALFRYPITAPVALFDFAQDTNLNDWEHTMNACVAAMPIASSFMGERPIKLLTLRSPFVADLLTRYVAIHVRLGAPDFSRSAITKFCFEIEAGQ